MGHCVGYRVVDKKQDIMPECREFAAINVNREENFGGSYHGNMTIIEHTICDDYDAAEAYLEHKAAGGFYNDYAVRFHDTSAVKEKTKKAEELETRLKKLYADKNAYVEAHMVGNHSAKFIGCPHCGSKLAREYVAKDHSNRCFVCGKDMRAKYIIDREKKYDTDAALLREKLHQEDLKKSSKAPIRWLVKIEVHT